MVGCKRPEIGKAGSVIGSPGWGQVPDLTVLIGNKSLIFITAMAVWLPRLAILETHSVMKMVMNGPAQTQR
jgi:hypothetical protein